ncbi:GerAB/ArcD/ProY family transporter [Neobacillus drentensis]|uniref:GerAB/ArcD/ProY family transporter n=1 Tax=Neobacillus drentensis TaxID=220684 RepID=UPI003B58948C
MKNIFVCSDYCYGSRLGMEPFTRSVEILFIPFVILLIILIISILPQVNVQNIQPVLKDGRNTIEEGSD